MSGLHTMVMRFAAKWGPEEPGLYDEFVGELRTLLEAYGKATLQHESLPDTEHNHGDPI